MASDDARYATKVCRIGTAAAGGAPAAVRAASMSAPMRCPGSPSGGRAARCAVIPGCRTAASRMADAVVLSWAPTVCPDRGCLPRRGRDRRPRRATPPDWRSADTTPLDRNRARRPGAASTSRPSRRGRRLRAPLARSDRVERTNPGHAHHPGPNASCCLRCRQPASGGKGTPWRAWTARRPPRDSSRRSSSSIGSVSLRDPLPRALRANHRPSS